MDSSNRSLFRKSFEEQKAKELDTLKRGQAARESARTASKKATSPPATAISDKGKTRVSPFHRGSVANKSHVGEAGRVQKPTTLKGHGTIPNNRVAKVAPKPTARAQEKRRAAEEAEQQARASVLVQANVITVKEFLDAQKGSQASVPAKAPSLPPHAAKNSGKKVLQRGRNGSPVSVDAIPNQVIGCKRPAAASSAADNKPSPRKRRKVLNTQPTSVSDPSIRNDQRPKPRYTGTARPRSAAPAAKIDNKAEQQPGSASDDSGGNGTRLLEVNGRKRRVIIEDSEDEVGPPPSKRHCPASDGTSVGRACSKPSEDAVHKPSITLERKASPCKRKREDDKDNFESQPDNDRSRIRKIRRTDSGSDKENARSQASSTSSEPSTKVPKRPASTAATNKVPAKGSFLELLARAKKVQAEKAEKSQQIGMIKHRPTPAPVLSARSTNIGHQVSVPSESTTASKAPRTEAQYEALRLLAEDAEKNLEAGQDLARDPKTRKYVRKELIGKTRQEKARISKDRERWHGIIHEFKEAKKERQKAIAAAEAKAQKADDEKEEPQPTRYDWPFPPHP